MRLSDLYGARVRTRDGIILGRVHAVHCVDGAITQIGVGVGSIKRHFAGHGRDRRIPWDSVIALKDGELTVARGSKPSRP